MHLSAHQLDTLRHDWHLFARPEQLAPVATAAGQPWRTWLFLGGRGAGKTRAGAEWIRAVALHQEAGSRQQPAGSSPPLPLLPLPAARCLLPRRLALIGPTIAHVRSVMIEGVSGLMAIHPKHERPVYEVSKDQLVWPNGSIAQCFSADNPEALRGPQFEAAWCDELCRWRKPESCWTMLQLALRIGDDPRAVVTTTPKSTPFLKRLVADPSTAVTHATTAANARNLAPTFLAQMKQRYDGTATGRQELDGAIVDTGNGDLWRRAWLDQNRITQKPDHLTRIVVAVDPPVTSTVTADACGIVVAALGADKRAYVLADRSIRGREPIVWARAAIAAYHDFAADRIVAEANQGGDLVGGVLRQVDPNVPIRLVKASRGKYIRAEPVSALYAEGRVIHVGEHVRLEEEMLSFSPDGRANGRSPDRLDALVWAITDLMLTNRPEPTLRRL